MKYIAITARGLEDISQKEIKEILKANSECVADGRILFTTRSIDKLLQKTQSIMKVYELHQMCLMLKDIQPFPIESPFRVHCSRYGAHAFSSQEVERAVGELFFKAGNTVDLKNSKTIVFVDIIDENIFVGVDKTPELLSKRAYRIKIHNQSINACIAYGLVRLSGYNGKKIFLDPFSKDGIIAIEAALYKKGKIFAYDALFPNVRSTEINATLAKVRKGINISRIEPEWLDTKFQKGEVDIVVSSLPFASKSNPEKDVRKLYKELFYQLAFILKKNGKLVFIVPKADLLKEMAVGFVAVEERIVSTSSLLYSIIIFKKE